MTRLITEWIRDMKDRVEAWDESLDRQVGGGLVFIAAKGAGRSEGEIVAAREKTKIAVIPITSGQGIIEEFSRSVASILEQMKFDVFITKHTDVAGIYEAKQRDADIVYLADDDRYIAMNLQNKRIGENDRATARGYTEVLEGMSLKTRGEGIRGKEVLILGYGRVGHEMYDYLEEKGAGITVYDYNEDRQNDLRREKRKMITSARKIRNYSLILDATSTGHWINPEMLADDVLIAAPGIPFSLDYEAEQKFKGRYVHDNLEIGTAVMLAYALGEE